MNVDEAMKVAKREVLAGRERMKGGVRGERDSRNTEIL